MNNTNYDIDFFRKSILFLKRKKVKTMTIKDKCDFFDIFYDGFCNYFFSLNTNNNDALCNIRNTKLGDIFSYSTNHLIEVVLSENKWGGSIYEDLLRNKKYN